MIRFLAGVAAGAFLATALGRWAVFWQEPETVALPETDDWATDPYLVALDCSICANYPSERAKHHEDAVHRGQHRAGLPLTTLGQQVGRRA